MADQSRGNSLLGKKWEKDLDETHVGKKMREVMRSAEKRRALSTTKGRSRAAQENFSFLFFPFSGFVGAETEDITTFLRAPIEGNSFRGFFNFPFWFPKRALNKRMCHRESQKGVRSSSEQKRNQRTQNQNSLSASFQFSFPSLQSIQFLFLWPFYLSTQVFVARHPQNFLERLWVSLIPARPGSRGRSYFSVSKEIIGKHHHTHTLSLQLFLIFPPSVTKNTVQETGKRAGR